ncbi:MAG: glycoside hydrolase family 130 protein [Chloroflexota bacterium]|nr:glycoside hydrolase family 130 protein [Chloroflexota bacterium]
MSETRLLRRHPQNPILTAADFPRAVNSAFNAGAVKFDGQYLLLTRVEDLTGSSCLWLARSDDGIHFTPDPEPALLPATNEPFRTVEHFSLEDPRITQIGDTYYITYVAYSGYGCVTALARTRDFGSYERVAVMTLPDNKDVVLFPEKIGDRYAKLDRPMTRRPSVGDMWISFSPDLVHWGAPRPVMTSQPRKWDSFKIGAGAPPIKTEQGWLEIYHGVRSVAAGLLYRLGAVLLHQEEPWQVVGRASEAILSPIAPEDFQGNVGNVVFTCGAILENDGELKVYYGAADQVMCLATASVDEVITLCLEGAKA